MQRTPYMQQLMSSTYPSIAIEAIQGGFDGSWERLIAKQISIDFRSNHSEACEIMESCNNAPLKAAFLITSSKIHENVHQ